MYVCIYIYIYIHKSIHICIYYNLTPTPFPQLAHADNLAMIQLLLWTDGPCSLDGLSVTVFRPCCPVRSGEFFSWGGGRMMGAPWCLAYTYTRYFFCPVCV